MRRRGSVLIGVLWCLVFLTLLVVGVLHTATLDLRVTKNYGDQIQAHYLAVAGLEKTKALLYHDAWERRRSRVNHSGKLDNAPESFRDVPLGRGFFQVIRQARAGEPPGLVYGVVDEESRLDLNRASAEELGKLPGITPEEVAAIIDYRDQDNKVTQGGAEAEQYAAFTPPYRPRNGPLRTVREVLMVAGINRPNFYGEDSNLNGLLDPEENDGNRSDPPDNRNGRLEAGWSEFVTLESNVRNVNAAGQRRVNAQEAGAEELAGVEGISPDLARAIVQWREQNRLETLADLLEVRAPNPRTQSRPNALANPPPNRGDVAPPPNRGPAPVTVTPPAPPASGRPGGPRNPTTTPARNNAGPPLIDETLLMDIADEVTVESDLDLPGRVNINTAPLEVLACLPGFSRELAQNVINYRASSGYFPNIAWLLKVPDMNAALFKQACPRITVRSQTFRVLSEGRVTATGARARIQATLRIGTFYVDTLAYREDAL
jgi:DNA uptake protein ComE-like DNA-binding protein